MRDRWRGDREGQSLSIPTWFYGHEPTNVFGTQVAKYFANALREDTLLHRCRGGIVFAPGAAGTVQEIFQAANDRFYGLRGTESAPLVLLGGDHWTTTLPAWPLLQALARDSPMARTVHVVDDVDEALELVTGRPARGRPRTAAAPRFRGAAAQGRGHTGSRTGRSQPHRSPPVRLAGGCAAGTHRVRLEPRVCGWCGAGRSQVRLAVRR